VGAAASRCVATIAVALAASACGTPAPQEQASSAGARSTGAGFKGGDCNGVSDAEVAKAVGSVVFIPAVKSDTGCFWQEDSVIGDVGVGMGISTWWYRGSDMDTERGLEQQAGRTLTELSIDGNKGFRAADDSACSIYVAKGTDVITWSIQTLNAKSLPNLCSIVDQLATLSQERVN
jgi:hypothetical protein